MSAISGSNIAKTLYETAKREFKEDELKSIGPVLRDSVGTGFDLTTRINSAYESRINLWTNALRSAQESEEKRTGKRWNVMIGGMQKILKSIEEEKTHIRTFSIQNQKAIEEVRQLRASNPEKYAKAIAELKQADEDLSTLVFFLSNPLYVKHTENKPSPSDDIDHLDEVTYPAIDPFELEVAEFEAASKGGPKHPNQSFFWVSDEEDVSINSDDEALLADLPPVPSRKSKEKRPAETIDGMHEAVNQTGPYYEGKEMVFKGSFKIPMNQPE